MSTKLDETPKEKLANATRAQHRAEADLRAATEALRQFYASHKVLDASTSKERQSLVEAQTRAAEALRDAKDAFNFCHHETFAIKQNWGRGQEPWRR
jgi:hypothetical protein